MPRAPRRCPGDNYECPNLIAGSVKYCPDHITGWGRRNQRTTSSAITNTAAWKRLRRKVLERDNHECQAREPGCTRQATQVDHIINTAAGGAPLDPNNAQAICPTCNARKAQRESAAAQRRRSR